LIDGLRLRTACDLDLVSLIVNRPEALAIPDTSELNAALPILIAAKGQFASPAFTSVTWRPKAKTKKDTPKGDHGVLESDEASDK
jgi:CRISPR-associated protein Csb1